MPMLSTIPALPVVKIDNAVAFYVEHLGFTAGYHDDSFAKLTRDAIELHLWAAYDEEWIETLAPIEKGRRFIPKDGQVCPVKSGAETFLAGTGSCRIEVSGIKDLFAEYRAKGVLHSPSTSLEDTDWGTKEFPAVDLHRNLLTFFERT